MSKKLAAAVVVIIAIAATAFIAWRNEWFVATPASVLRHSLMDANAGNYEAACQNLPTGERTQLLENPQLMKNSWDHVTKNRTIESVTVNREDRGIIGTFGDIDITIKYKDGSTLAARTKISYLHDRWSFGVGEISDAIAAQDRKRAEAEFQTWKIELAKEYTRVGNSGVLLRVPEGLIWDPEKQAYDHPKYQILIQAERRIRANFNWLASFAEQDWKSPKRILERRDDLSKGKVKAVLFDGDLLNEQGRGWRSMHLLIGDENQATSIRTTFPKFGNFMQAMRECLTSAKWDPSSK